MNSYLEKKKKEQLKKLDKEMTLTPIESLDKNEKMYFHLTYPKNFNTIMNEGLCGSRIKGRVKDGVKRIKKTNTNHTDLSDGGYVYLVDSEDKRIWNGISTTQLVPNKLGEQGGYGKNLVYQPHMRNRSKKNTDIILNGRNGEPYKVIGIYESSFTDRGFVIEEDRKEMELLVSYFKRVFINDTRIPPSELFYVYDGLTDTNDYDTDTIWREMSEKYDTPLEDLKFDSGIYGIVKYSERFQKNDKTTSLIDKRKFLKGYSRIDIEKDKEERKRNLNPLSSSYRKVG